MLKKILMAIGVLIALLIALTILLTVIAPVDFAAEREVVINKPKSEVFNYLKFVKNQNNWAVWNKKDPNMKQTYEGTDGTVGFISSWESNHEEVGSGSQKITKIVDGERIDTELRFKQPFESTSQSYLLAEDAGENKTKVKWGFSGSFPRPFNIMLLFMDIEKAVEKDFDEGLASLKQQLENPSQ